MRAEDANAGVTVANDGVADNVHAGHVAIAEVDPDEAVVVEFAIGDADVGFRAVNQPDATTGKKAGAVVIGSHVVDADAIGIARLGENPVDAVVAGVYIFDGHIADGFADILANIEAEIIAGNAKALQRDTAVVADEADTCGGTAVHLVGAGRVRDEQRIVGACADQRQVVFVDFDLLVERSCFYFDGVTGEGVAIVNRRLDRAEAFARVGVDSNRAAGGCAAGGWCYQPGAEDHVGRDAIARAGAFAAGTIGSPPPVAGGIHRAAHIVPYAGAIAADVVVLHGEGRRIRGHEPHPNVGIVANIVAGDDDVLRLISAAANAAEIHPEVVAIDRVVHVVNFASAIHPGAAGPGLGEGVAGDVEGIAAGGQRLQHQRGVLGVGDFVARNF